MSKNKDSIWIDREFLQTYKQDNVKCGLRIVCDDKINNSSVLRIKNFLMWIRKKFYFPIKCTVFLKDQAKFRSNNGKGFCQGIFFTPEELQKGAKYPCIYTAANTDLRYLKFTILHELTHYFQWYFLQDETRTDKSLEIEANGYAYWLLNEYESSET